MSCGSSDRRLAVLVCVYVIYLFMGAAVFNMIESPHEARIISDLNTYVQLFRMRHNSCVSEQELNEFIKLISVFNDRGVPATRNVSKEQNWSFGQSVFYAGTVLTTIGYGSFSPLTKLGKLFCILFALVGIPATLLLLYAIIERLMKLTGRVLAAFIDKAVHLCNRLSVLSCMRVQRSHLHIAFALLSTLVVLVIFFLIPAAVYSHIENWSYLNAFYYCFISLTTVGLGDYVPGDAEYQEYRHLYKICSIVYLLMGVLTMVWLLEVFSATPEFNFYKYFTLTENGILTHHRDKVHDLDEAQQSAALKMTKTSSSLNYKRQFDENPPELDSPEQTARAFQEIQ